MHYLRAFAKVLSVLAAKGPREEWAMVFNEHARSALQTEREIHRNLEAYGVSAEEIREIPMAPTNYAYRSIVR